MLGDLHIEQLGYAVLGHQDVFYPLESTHTSAQPHEALDSLIRTILILRHVDGRLRRILHAHPIGLGRSGLFGDLFSQLDNLSFHFRIARPFANSLEVFLHLAREVEPATSGADGERILHHIAAKL
jgi:hypothetical protein